MFNLFENNFHLTEENHITRKLSMKVLHLQSCTIFLKYHAFYIFLCKYFSYMLLESCYLINRLKMYDTDSINYAFKVNIKS